MRPRVAAGSERARVGPATVEAQQDGHVGAEHLAQPGEHAGQGAHQPGRFPRAEHHRPAAGVDQQRVVPAGLGVATFGVPPLRDRPRTAVGHEMVVDEVHRVGGGAGGQHPRGERPLQAQRVAVLGQGRAPGPQRAQLRGGRLGHQGAGLGPAQVLGGLHGAGTQREAQRRGGQHAKVAVPAGRATGQRREDHLGADQVQVGV